ncbi:hypothetical protein ABIA30_004572 [Mycobacterium sp. MAA66]
MAADTNSFKLARQSEMRFGVDDTTFEQELTHRLQLIEPADGNALTVPDLPLMDFAVAVTGLALAIVLLIAWAY